MMIRDVLETFKLLLRVSGYAVRTAATGAEGLQLAEQYLPSLVLLDVGLPDLNGVEVCRRIKSDPKLTDVSVVLISGGALTPAHKAGGFDAGADGYLTKPVALNELLARIRAVLRLHDTTVALRASEQRYRQLVEILPDAVCLLDLESRFVAVNSQAARMLGCDGPGTFPGQSALTLAAQETRATFQAHLAKALETGGLEESEYLFVRRNGERFPVELSAAKSTDAQGRPAGLVLVAREITERKRVEEELRGFPRRIIEAQEAERKRVARELHDGVNQILASAKMRLRSLEAHLTSLDPAATETLARCDELLVRALEENRRIAYGLRPSDLDELGLAEACQNLCLELQSRTGLPVVCRVSIPAQRLPAAVELNLFRIVQEALANVERHAHATAVSVSLALQDGALALRIRDNGRGLQAVASTDKTKRRGIGLTNIRERTLALGGLVKSSPSQKRGWRSRCECRCSFKRRFQPSRRRSGSTGCWSRAAAASGAGRSGWPPSARSS